MKCKNCSRYVKKEEYYDDTYGWIGYCFVCLNDILDKRYLTKYEKEVQNNGK